MSKPEEVSGMLDRAGEEGANSPQEPLALLLGREVCKARAQDFLAHFTSKLIHSQSNSIGVRVDKTYAKNLPYLCASRLLHDGHSLGLDYIGQGSKKEENGLNPHILRVLECRRKERAGQVGKAVERMAKDNYSSAEIYEDIVNSLPAGEIGDGLCPRCKQVLLPVVASDDDWLEFDKIEHIAVTPLSNGWLNGYFFERYFEWKAEIAMRRECLAKTIEDLEEAKKACRDKEEAQRISQSIEPLFAEMNGLPKMHILDIPWPVGGRNRVNVTNYYQRMAFFQPPQVSHADRKFFSILYGNRTYGRWNPEEISAYLSWENANPEESRRDSLALDDEILKFFISGVRMGCAAVLRDHYTCTQSSVYAEFEAGYRKGVVIQNTNPFYTRIVFGDFSYGFCQGLATHLANSLSSKLRGDIGLSESLRNKLTKLFFGAIREFF